MVEVLAMNPELEELITKGASSSKLAEAAELNGTRPLAAVALEPVRAGVTTLEEIEGVLGDSTSSCPYDAYTENALTETRASS